MNASDWLAPEVLTLLYSPELLPWVVCMCLLSFLLGTATFAGIQWVQFESQVRRSGWER